MQIDIKCAECGKITRNFELGKVCLSVKNPSQTFRIVESIICPKCGKDISEEKCRINKTELVFSIMAAGMDLLREEEQPEHLKGIIIAKNDCKISAKSKPLLVEKL